MLKPVKQSQQFKGAISNATNYQLEGELLSVPLWLYRSGYEEEAGKVLRFLAQVPGELFVRHVHRQLRAAYEALATRGLPLTDGFLQQLLSDAGSWTDHEEDRSKVSPGFLAELEENCPVRLTVRLGEPVFPLVKEMTLELGKLFHRRQVIHASEGLLQKATDWNEGNEAVVNDAFEELARAFNQRPGQQNTAATVSELIHADVKQIASGIEPDRLMTEFPSIDKPTGGFMPGNLVVLAARTSMGKTSLALDFVVNMAKRDVFCFYNSIEMTRVELARLLGAKDSRVNVLRLRHGALENWQLDAYRDCAGRDWAVNIIVDEGNLTPNGIEAKVRDFNRRLHPFQIGLIVVDHLQIMGAGDKTRYERHDLRIGAYTGQLKDMAKRLGCVVLLLSQLNRQSAQRTDDQRLPRLSDLRGSGSIEQDADCVIGLYRKFLDTRNDADKNRAQIAILKNRSGPLGDGELHFSPELAMFSELDDPPF